MLRRRVSSSSESILSSSTQQSSEGVIKPSAQNGAAQAPLSPSPASAQSQVSRSAKKHSIVLCLRYTLKNDYGDESRTQNTILILYVLQVYIFFVFCIFAELNAGKLLHICLFIYKTKVHCLSLEITKICKHACNIIYFTHLSKDTFFTYKETNKRNKMLKV